MANTNIKAVMVRERLFGDSKESGVSFYINGSLSTHFLDIDGKENKRVESHAKYLKHIGYTVERKEA